MKCRDKDHKEAPIYEGTKPLCLTATAYQDPTLPYVQHGREAGKSLVLSQHHDEPSLAAFSFSAFSCSMICLLQLPM